MKEVILEYITQELLSNRTDVQLLPEDDLLGSGLVDSIGMMQLVGFIEEAFNVQIPFEDITIEHFMTVDAIDGYLEHRTRQAAEQK